MNEKELKAYQEKLMSGAKGTIGLGILTGVGTYGFSRVGAAHPTTAPAMGAATSALQLANVGNLAAVGMSLMPGQKNPDKKKNTKEQNDIINKFY